MPLGHLPQNAAGLAGTAPPPPLLLLLLLCALPPRGVLGAGSDMGGEAGALYAQSREAQTLHLEPGEAPREHIWGAGMIEETLEADVLVAGGGSAGTSAALAAARNGATVVLANGRPVLGGNSGSEVRLRMVGACGGRSAAGNALQLECREGGIVEEYQLDNAVNNPDLVPELFSLELLTLMKAEPNLTLYQNTWLVGVTKEEGAGKGEPGTITSAILEDQGSQRRYIVKAKQYIDATGDGRLGAEAGAEWIQGREGAAKYNESLAQLEHGEFPTDPSGPDHETEGTTLDYTAEAKPERSTFRAPFWATKFTKSEFQYRGVTGDRPYGFWWNEVSWPYNTITDGENVTQEALANILGIFDYLKNSGDHPESAKMGLTWFGNWGCKREGRRFIGQYVQSQNDVMAVDRLCTRKPPWCERLPIPSKHAQEPLLYWDRVAYAGWPFDLHNPKGMKDPTSPPFTSHKMPYMYSTPLRSLVSKDLTNLFFAGRLASFSHVVYGSQRVMKTCATMGQATGTAAAYAVAHGIAPIELKDHPEAVWSIQQQLLRDDAFIIGKYNADPRDHALAATVTASSERPNSTACSVISGQSRAVVSSTTDVTIGHGGGVPASQAKSGTNRWISEGLPASVSLTLAAPVAVKQVQLVFDTGMHRTLSWAVTKTTNSPAYYWGPQPETVRDYLIEGEVDGKWVTMCNVSGNYQRRRVHTLPCPTPEPEPTPPAQKPVVAAGSVSATYCNVSEPSQQWTLTKADGDLLSVRSADQELCLGFDANTSAYGGHGNSVVARPCGASPVLWRWSASPGGSFLQTAEPHDTCSGFPGQRMACECVHPVVCTACHGTEVYTPPTSVELIACTNASHMHWSSLSVNDGRAADRSVMLMTGGLCLQGPPDQNEVGHEPAPAQRVQAKNAQDVAAEAAAVPAATAVRVTVTATNGIADARINEIRLYDAEGVAPFPRVPERADLLKSDDTSRIDPQQRPNADDRTHTCDVVIAGGSLASAAAAVAAGETSGTTRVCFLEITDWPGVRL